MAKKCELQSILGKLLWVSRTVRFSRIFVSRIIAEVRKLQKQSEKVTLSYDIKKDFLWWDRYLIEFSGVEIIPSPSVNQAVYGDACPIGGGSWNPTKSEFFSIQFPQYMSSADVPIHIKEFIVLIFSIRLWGPHWKGQRITLYCDNDAVCDTCTLQKPKGPKLQQLLREYLFWVCTFNFFPIVEKISSKENCVADFISRVYNSNEIDDYFCKSGYSAQSRVDIPSSWFNFQAEW